MRRRRNRGRHSANARPPKPAPESSDETKSFPFGAALLILFALSLGMRVVHALAIDRSPMGDLLMGDGRSYHAWALALSSGDWLGSEVFYQAPLYPYLLGLLYSVFAPDLWVVRLAQAILGSLACVFLALAGAKWFSPRVGALAGALLALYGPALFYGAIVQKTTLSLFLFCLWLWLVGRTAEDASGPAKRWFAIGLCLSALVLTRENTLILIAPLLAWLTLGPGDRKASVRMRSVFALAAGVAVLLVPVGVRNRHFGGAFQLTTAQLGPNLYIGNHPGADGIYRPLRPGRGDARFERVDAQAFAEDRTGRPLSPAEVSSFYVGEVWRYVREQPLDWTSLMWRKLRLVANAVEIADTEDASTHGEDSAILAAAGRVWHFGILLPLAALGCYWTWPDRRRLWLLHALALLYTASVVSFYVFGRYRFPLVPLLILLAAAALYELPRTFRTAGNRRILAGAALVLLVAGVSNWPMIDDRLMQSVTRFNYGLGLEKKGSLPEARAQYERAVRLQPGLAEAHYRLGILDLKEHAVDSAVSRFEAALRFDPALHDVHNSLGMALLERGDLDAAETHFAAALRTWRDDSQALNNLAHAAFRKREYALAESRYRRALEVDAKNPQTHNNLGILAAIRGDVDSAIGHFRDALALDPSYAEARANLERALEST